MDTSGEKIRYRAGIKYWLAEDHITHVDILGCYCISEYIELDQDGTLTIRHGYAWDGPSGPTIDRPENMRGALVHDALYNLMRLGLLSSRYRQKADHEFIRRCNEDGLNDVSQWFYEEAVHNFASGAAKKGSEPYPILEAP